MPSLTIWHLYPQDMNIYGDRGNVIVLRQRAAWRGYTVSVRTADVGQRVDADDCDLVFAGGGQDDQQGAVARDLRGANGHVLRELAEAGVPMLLVCGTYQLFGHYFRTGSGEEIRGVSILDFHTVAGPRRLIGDTLVSARPGGVAEGAERDLVGFENHSGQTFLGPGCRPLGRAIVGGGNNSVDGGEGAVFNQVHGTYLHGPVLPKNPWFADHLIAAALRRKGVVEPLAALDDSVETRAHSAIALRVRRVGRRVSGAI